MIFGRPGSGKSTFAHALHNSTKIPLFHLDKYFYTSNWMQRDYVEFMEIQNEIVNKDTWIVDGNCTKSFETRYSRADLCVYFNYPIIVCLWRVCIRIFQNRDHIDDRAENCPEIVRWQLIKYMWTFKERVKDKIAALQEKYPQVQFVEVNNNTQVKNILQSIEAYFFARKYEDN